MPRGRQLKLDTIGQWTEMKLEILQRYAAAYSAVMSAQRGSRTLSHVYIDAFAGSGLHISKEQKTLVLGSPLNALFVQPPFKELHLIDLDGVRTASLSEIMRGRPNVFVYQGDCNVVLLDQVFPKVRFSDYRRALCLLDPYGLHLDWRVIETAGRMGTIEIFLNFPVHDMQRNVFLPTPGQMRPEQACRMDRLWGDETWRETKYEPPRQLDLFGGPELQRIPGSVALLDAFRDRLKRVASFKYVPEPLPMRYSGKGVLYYLFFAGNNRTGEKIARWLMDKYRT